MLARLAILGASHEAAHWLTPWRDLSIKRECTELGHYSTTAVTMVISTSSATRSRSSHGHVIGSTDGSVPATARLRCACCMAMMPWGESVFHVRRAACILSAACTSSPLSVQQHAACMRNRISYDTDSTISYVLFIASLHTSGTRLYMRHYQNVCLARAT